MINNFLNSFATPKAIFRSFGVAAVCSFFDSSLCSKLKTAAMGIALVGSAIYGYNRLITSLVEPGKDTTPLGTSLLKNKVSKESPMVSQTTEGTTSLSNQTKKGSAGSDSTTTATTSTPPTKPPTVPASSQTPKPSPSTKATTAATTSTQTKKPSPTTKSTATTNQLSQTTTPSCKSSTQPASTSSTAQNVLQGFSLVNSNTPKQLSAMKNYFKNNATVVEGNLSQYTANGRRHACTVIAATALVEMLKIDEHRESFNSDKVDKIVRDGIQRDEQILKELKKESVITDKTQDPFLSWDECYGTQGGFSNELETYCITCLPTELKINLTIDNNSNEYFSVLNELANWAIATKQPQGGILVMHPETYAVSISPTDNDQLIIRFFDSHGSFLLSNSATMIQFNNLRILANYLKVKKQLEPSMNEDFNRCGLYPCTLRKK